ncbi:hypothetical protein BD410DRAFT_510309 [Rickenella mellea]|uniref:Uncharacterized protein n=1 Tax=Rickenella mellea TaxID=50990 RepID=A0A4Y7PSJ0_9AGAM|nr:hypothetical protein BD410DRAFT_510309 [Rickenella mellea]
MRNEDMVITLVPRRCIANVILIDGSLIKPSSPQPGLRSPVARLRNFCHCLCRAPVWYVPSELSSDLFFLFGLRVFVGWGVETVGRRLFPFRLPNVAILLVFSNFDTLWHTVCEPARCFLYRTTITVHHLFPHIHSLVLSLAFSTTNY